jgi:hypothetical protein
LFGAADKPPEGEGLMKRTYRLTVAVIACFVACSTGCGSDDGDDDTDPNSQTCKDIRAHYLQIKIPRDEAAKAGVDTTFVDVKLAQLKSSHIDCFPPTD